MKFAICNETFQDWPHDQALQYAHDCGYTGIEFAPFTLGPDASQVTQATRAEIRRLLDQFQLQPVGLHWLLAKTEGLYLTSPEESVRHAFEKYALPLADRGHISVADYVTANLDSLAMSLSKSLLEPAYPNAFQDW